MAPKIALFANRDSAQLAEIAAAVTDQGGEPLLFDIRVGGADGPAVAFGAGGASWGGVPFEAIRAVHIRCMAPRALPVMPALSNAVAAAEYRVEYLREQAFNAATHAFFDHLVADGTLVVNRPAVGYIDHDTKGQFYEALRAAGFTVPLSLSTNDPEEASRFLDRVGEAVIKPAIGIGSTRLVGAHDRKCLDELRRCPALFQERIVGDTIRIHVVGDRMVLALRIQADGIDSRTGTQGFSVIGLPEEEGEAVVRATRHLGLHYAAWDAIAGADGRLRLLDCNPGPFVMWLAPEDRRTVFGALARYLIDHARGAADRAVPADCQPDLRH